MASKGSFRGVLPPLPRLEELEEGGEELELTGEIEESEEDYEEDPETGDFVPTKKPEEEKSEEFGKNLAEILPQEVLSKYESSLKDAVVQDKQSREKRDKQYEEGIRRTGLGNDAPGGAQFNGASRVVHPILAEGSIDFAARVLKELWPPNGPVKTHIPGTVTKKKLEKGERKAKFLNQQLRFKIVEFKPELEQTLTQVPLGGDQYMKFWWDSRLKRPKCESVYLDNVYLPYYASDFRGSYRKTLRVELTEDEVRRRIDSGWYIDIPEAASEQPPEPTNTEKANDKVQGQEQAEINQDGVRNFWEIYTELSLEEDKFAKGEPAPYIITMEPISGKIVGWYRNWDERDEKREELQWIVEFPFIRWRGAYAIGLIHLIGGLSAALTGSIRALLDSAHINTAPTMLMLKGSRISGQNQQVEITGVSEIDAGPGVNDIRQVAMPMPFNQPSPVLVDLFTKLDAMAKGVVRTSMDDVGADMSPNVPVGTQMSRVEQGLVVYSTIFTRMHESMQQVLSILHRLYADNLDEETQIEDMGEEVVTREDFEGPCDVMPVSDPSLFSELQRQAQIAALVQRSDTHPQLYNQLAVEKTLLKSLKVDNVDELLIKDPDPEELDAVSENVHASLGKPVKVYPKQNHKAHLVTHAAYITKIASNMLMAIPALPTLIEHLRDHVIWWYGHSMAERFPVESREELNSPQLAELQAEASQQIPGDIGQELATLMPLIQQAKQLVQQLMPAQPMDPSQAALQAKQMDAAIEDKRLQAKSAEKQQELQMDAQLKSAELEANTRNEQEKRQFEAQKLMAELQTTMQEIAARMQAVELQVQGRTTDTQLRTEAQLGINSEDNETALTIAGARMAADVAEGREPDAGGITTGNAVTNPSP